MQSTALLLGSHQPAALVLCENIFAKRVSVSAPYTKAVSVPNLLTKSGSFVKPKQLAVGEPKCVAVGEPKCESQHISFGFSQRKPVIVAEREPDRVAHRESKRQPQRVAVDVPERVAVGESDGADNVGTLARTSGPSAELHVRGAVRG